MALVSCNQSPSEEFLNRKITKTKETNKHAFFDKHTSLTPLPSEPHTCCLQEDGKRVWVVENSPNSDHKDTLDEFTIS